MANRMMRWFEYEHLPDNCRLMSGKVLRTGQSEWMTNGVAGRCGKVGGHAQAAGSEGLFRAGAD